MHVRPVSSGRRSTTLVMLVAALAIGSVIVSHAQLPGTLSYQGQILDDDGRPVSNGVHQIDVALYADEISSKPLWQESHLTEFTGGLFSIYLGSINPLNLPFDSQYWLGVSFDGNGEMVERTPLSSSPYAVRSQIAGELDGGAVRSINGQQGALKIIGTGSTVVTELDGTIMIGTTTPKSLQGDGKVDLTPVDAQIATDGYTVIHINDLSGSGSDLIDLQVDSSDVFLLESNGDLTTTGMITGVGASFSSQRVQDVADPTAAQDAATKNYVDTRDAVYDVTAEPFLTFEAGTAKLTNNRVLAAGTGVSITDAAIDNGSMTVAIGQDVATTASPTFSGVTLTNVSPNSTSTEVLVSNGGDVESRTANSLAPEFHDDFWRTDGNTGTTPGTDFLGTSDQLALHLYVNGGTDNSLILNTNGSVQRDVGGDSRGADAVDMQIMRANGTEVSSGDYATIGGGSENTASGQSATVAGGHNNDASGNLATIAGGEDNRAMLAGFVGGGGENVAGGLGSVVVGGGGSYAGGDFSFVGGGNENGATGSHAVIGGGKRNVSSGYYASVGGGGRNHASGDSSTVGGGTYNVASGRAATIGGGHNNEASGDIATIAGGEDNRAMLAGFVGGGGENVAGGLGSVVVGGGGSYAGGDFSFVGGGNENAATGSHATVVGGKRNTASGSHSAIPGGSYLTLTGNSSFGYHGGSPSMRMSIGAESVAVFGNTDMWLANNDGAASQLRFYESNVSTGAFPNGTNYTSFVAGTQSADINYTLPTSAPASDGHVLSSTAAGSMTWVDPTVVARAWNLDGNAGTNAGTDYVGTSDQQALHIYVNGGSDNSLILNTNGSVQRDGGGNARGTEAVDLQATRSNAGQAGTGNYSVISGGLNNMASGVYTSVGGGTGNRATTYGSRVGGGDQNNATDSYSSIGGGFRNSASGFASSAVGGYSNKAEDSYAAVGGGLSNRASGYGSLVAGGSDNIASGPYANVAGGAANTASSISTIGGGYANTASAFYSIVGGGLQNRASGAYSTVVGGSGNTVSGDYSTLLGSRGLELSGNGSLGFLGGNDNGSKNMRVAASSTALFGNIDLWLANNDGAASQLRFYEANGTSGDFPVNSGGTIGSSTTVHYTSFEAGDQADDINYTLPTALPTANGQVLSSSTGGEMSWVDPLANSNVFTDVHIEVRNTDNTARGIRFFEPSSSGSSYTAFVARPQAGNIVYTLPSSAPASDGRVMTSTTAGELSWSNSLTLSSLTTTTLTTTSLTATSAEVTNLEADTVEGDVAEFANASSSISTMSLNNSGTGGISLEVAGGGIQLGSASYTALSSGKADDAGGYPRVSQRLPLAIVTDRDGNSGPYAVRPPASGTNGQLLYIMNVSGGKVLVRDTKEGAMELNDDRVIALIYWENSSGGSGGWRPVVLQSGDSF